MKQIAKRKLNGKQILLIVLASLLLLLSITYAIVMAVISNIQSGGTETEPPEILDGEDYYLNTAIAYPRVEEAEILYIIVSNKNGTFDLTRWPDDKGSFWLSYDSGDGVSNMIQYIPPIAGAEGDFDYESLYAAENNSGYGQAYLLTYLCAAIGTPYFNERIELPSTDTPEGSAEREMLLRRYGFDTREAQTISFAYQKNADGGNEEQEGNHSITIGGNAVSGSGYYYMVDGRDYIYYTSSTYFKYALMGFNSFVKGMLVAEGISFDKSFEPYLTTDFKQWVNELHKAEENKVVTVTEGANVVVKGHYVLPLNEGASYIPPAGAPTDGYSYSKVSSLTFDLEELKKHPDYKRISNTLVGLEVGKSYVADNIIITLISELIESDSKRLHFGDKDKLTYSYSITAIESIITDSGEIFETSGDLSKVGDNDLIKVSYNYLVDGEAGNSLECHAVIDLSNPLLDAAAVAKLRDSSLGRLPAPIEMIIEYTKENAMLLEESIVIKEIVEIYAPSGKTAETVAEDSYVIISYYETINGEEGDISTMLVNIAQINNNEKWDWDTVKSALVGKSKGQDVNLTVHEATYQYEAFRDFTAYSLSEVEYFITSELVTSFKFCNASERDPYYGESFYENTIDNEYRFYGLNASSCENVVKFLGGVGTSGTTSSAGLSGETVAVGLTHDVMERYGLYAYKIYFELPRFIKDISENTEFDDEDMLSDYDWCYTLGFTLYISEKKYDTEDGTPYRYVGSDMYDLVARVDGEEFDFLEYSFIDFWARQNMLLMNISELEKLEISFNMEDLYGKYNFDIDSSTIYLGSDGNQMFARDEYFEGSTEAEKFYVYISASGERMDTEFEKLLSESADGRVSITNIYNVVNNGGKPMHASLVDTEGVSNFKEVYELVMLTQYQDTLTEDEQKAALLTDPVMTMRMKISNTAYYYTYDFHRFDDRRVMVRVYQTNSAGEKVTGHEVSDFYITTFAFKKLASNFVNLLNGVIIDSNIGYID